MGSTTHHTTNIRPNVQNPICTSLKGTNQALHTLDLKVISPLFSTELNINMGSIKLILANQQTNLEIE